MRITLESLEQVQTTPDGIPVIANKAPAPVSADEQERRLMEALQAASTPKQQEIVPRKVDVCTLSENTEKGSYELRFPGPINKAMSTQLSLNGWKFARRQWLDPCWYCKKSPASRQFGLAIVKVTHGVSELAKIEVAT